VGKKICLSNTSYHPDLWQPAWGIRTMVEALRSHFPIPGDGAIGAIDWPSDLRKRLAKESLDFVCQQGGKPNRELLPELSPDELREEMPEPVPFLPPGTTDAVGESVVEPEPVTEVHMPEGETNKVPAAPDVLPEVDTANPLSPQAEGLRQRRGGSPGEVSGGWEPQPEVDVAVASAAVLPPTSGGSSENASVGGTAAAVTSAVETPSSPTVVTQSQPRRRREGPRPQRRPQQPLLVQLLKPPQTGRGGLLLVINLLICLLTMSFLYVLADIFKNPPKLLEPLPESKESKD